MTKNKTAKHLGAVVLSFIACLLVSSCDIIDGMLNIRPKEDEEDIHEHTYDFSSWSYDEEEHWHPSTCGHDQYKYDLYKHEFNQIITPPTYEEDGYTTYKCDVCGYSYVADYERRLEHKFSYYWLNDEHTHWKECFDEGYKDLRGYEQKHDYDAVVTEPTYYENGYTTYTCKVCEYTYTDDIVEKLKINVTVESEDINKGTVSGGGVFNIDESVTIKAKEMDGYEFLYWMYKGNTKIEENPYTFSAQSYNDGSYQAVFSKKHQLIVKSIDETKGTVSGSGSYGERAVNIMASPKVGYKFEGWYNLDDVLLSNSYDTYIDMPNEDYAIIAKFVEYKPVKKDLYNFGEYPQSRVTNKLLITKLNNMAGTLPNENEFYNWTKYEFYIQGNAENFMWYQDVTYNDIRYRGVYFIKYRPEQDTWYCEPTTEHSYQDDNGYYINNVYWFKFETIQFKVLGYYSSTNTLFGSSNNILDSYYFSRVSYYKMFKKKEYKQGKWYDVYGNNYEYSELRTFLNTDFYNTAFNDTCKEKINEDLVRNSAPQFNSHKYYCNDTYDKVFVLNEDEIFSYGFNVSSGEDEYRQLVVTDYAACMGCKIEYVNNKPCAKYWLRSPLGDEDNGIEIYSYEPCYAKIVRANGSVPYGSRYSSSYGHVNENYFGVAPALKINYTI